MRILNKFKFLLAAPLLALALVPKPAQASTTNNCPTEPAQNVTITSGETFYGTNCVLNTTGDVDSFQFSAASGSTYSVTAGLGPAPTADVCLTLYAPGVPATVLFGGCSSYQFGGPTSVSTIQKLPSSGLYTIKISEKSNAALSYGVTLERLNPAPPEAVALTLSKNLTGTVSPITAQNSYTFSGSTAGEYQITASLAPNPTSNVCFDVYQPDGTNVAGGCTSYQFGGPTSVQTDLTPVQSGTFVVIVFAAGNDSTVSFNLEVACLLGTCPTKCLLEDSLVYSNGTLTMNFTIGTPNPVVWDAWLVSNNSTLPLWSQTQPITEPQTAITKTLSIAPSGVVGVLSTLTTTKQGITCSTWNHVSTGTP
jgi:hypothetical protein